MNRKANFFAGPSALPFPVLRKIEETIVEYDAAGMSIIEASHRSKHYEEVHSEAVGLIREILGVPSNYRILLLGGGATLQFSMVPLNLMPKNGTCDFVISGSWAKKAHADAEKIGSVNVLFDGVDDGYSSLPASVTPTEGSSYVHITSNETINGVQWPELPDTGNVPLVVDMSSDIMSRPIDFDRCALLYAGAQKNLGPAGVTLVVVREDLLERSDESLTAYLSYATHAGKDSLYNTPPVFSVYALMLVLRWVKSEGGMEEMRRRSIEKSKAMYSVIDESDGFYRCLVEPAFRSRMNVVFKLSDEESEKAFISKAEEEGMVGLKGHRSVGGCRASLYNGVSTEWTEQLCEFMSRFARSGQEVNGKTRSHEYKNH